MDRRWRKILLGAGTAMLVFYLILSWYRYHYSMTVVEGFEVNAPELDKRLLIVTQGSRFKNAIVDALVDQMRRKPVHIKVIDVSELAGVDEVKWTALVMLHTWETWRPPLEAKHFIRRLNAPEKVVVVSTSASGEAKMEGVDAITAVSKMGEVTVAVDAVMARLDPLLH